MGISFFDARPLMTLFEPTPIVFLAKAVEGSKGVLELAQILHSFHLVICILILAFYITRFNIGNIIS